MSRSCCKLHSLRTRIAVRILPPCKRRALDVGTDLLLTLDAVVSHVAAEATGDTAEADQAEAMLRDLGVIRGGDLS